MRVRLVEDRSEYLRRGGTDAAPGLTQGLQVVDPGGAGGEGDPAGAGAAVVEVLLHPQVARLRGDQADLVLRHELVHARFDQTIVRGEPLWWREGVAEWLAHAVVGGTPGGEASRGSASGAAPSGVGAVPGAGGAEGARAGRYARAGRAVRALAVADEEVVHAVDEAWGSTGLPDASRLGDFLADRGVGARTRRQVVAAVTDEAR